MPPRPSLAELLFPARDVSFGTLVRRLSEPETGPHADNFITNEDSFPRVCGELARRVPEGGVYLGVGPDQNFTYIAQTRPDLSLVADFRRRNLLVHLLHKALFSLSADRDAYLAQLTARRPAKPTGADATAAQVVDAYRAAKFDADLLTRATTEVTDLLAPLNLVRDEEWAELATIQARIAGPGLDARFLALPIYPTLAELILTTNRDGHPAHFLADERLYRRVHLAQLDDRLVPIIGDLAGSIALPRLAAFLRDRRLEIATVYVSDAEYFLLRDGAEPGRFDAYVANLARLPRRDAAVIVRSTTRAIEHPDRVEGDRGTTIVRSLSQFLDQAGAGRFRSPNDLFAAPN